MKFVTAINCMDGRIQLPLINYLKDAFEADYVDLVTEAGPNLILAQAKDKGLVESILNRVRISVEEHGSQLVAIAGHYDCAGNPAAKQQQVLHIQGALSLLRDQFSEIQIIGLWVDRNWQVQRLQ
jgi:carbonic anhydrase